jgi:hypothetical protein
MVNADSEGHGCEGNGDSDRHRQKPAFLESRRPAPLKQWNRRVIPLANRTLINTKNIQPIGDSLNACTLLKMPLRVRNVAKLHKP